MKKILALVAAVALTFSLSAQTLPSSKTRGGADFTQVDQYLSVIKRLGIPTANADTLNGLTSGSNSVKILYNTTLRKLRVYDPVADEWRDAIEADLTNYYTKAEVDALIVAIPKPDMSKYVRKDTSNGVDAENWSIDYANTDTVKFSIDGEEPWAAKFKMDFKSRFNRASTLTFADSYIESSGFDGTRWNGFQIDNSGLSVTNPNGRANLGQGGITIEDDDTQRLSSLNISNKIGGGNSSLVFPVTGDLARVIPVSVNGQYANDEGEISMPTGATSLQTLTTGAGNNFTSNAIMVTGADNITPELASSTGTLFSKNSFSFLTGDNNTSTIQATSDYLKLTHRLGSALTLQNQDETKAGAHFNSRVSGTSPQLPNEFVTLGALTNYLNNFQLSNKIRQDLSNPDTDTYPSTKAVADAINTKGGNAYLWSEEFSNETNLQQYRPIIEAWLTSNGITPRSGDTIIFRNRGTAIYDGLGWWFTGIVQWSGDSPYTEFSIPITDPT